MGILIISPYIYPCIIGGMEIFYYYLINELSKYYNDLYIFTMCDQVESSKYLSYIRLDNSFLLIPNLSVFMSILFKVVKIRNRIDLIIIPYTSNSYLAYPALIIYMFFKIPYVISIHGGGMYQWRPKFIQELFFKNAAEIIAVSKPVKNEYEGRVNRTIRLIPPLIPFVKSDYSKKKLRKKYGFDPNNKLILSVGSIKRIKGSDLLFRGFSNLGIEYIKKNRLKLVYVGGGEMKDSLTEEVRNRGFEEFVKFIDPLPHEKIPEVYKMADIYVIPSLFEGTPKSLLEAMYNEMPIIGANVVGIKNVITHNENGMLFNLSDENDLTEKIKSMVKNEPFSMNLGSNARKKYEENFKFEKMVSDYISVIDNIRRK